MGLFIENSKGLVDIAPEARTIKQFKKIITRDKDRFKKRALSELAFIYFYADTKSEFNKNFVDEDSRAIEIKASLDDLEDGWKIDKDIRDAIDLYIKMNTTVATRALEFQRKNIDALLTNINTLSASADANDLSKVAKISLDVPAILESLKKIEEIVKGEQATENRHKGNQDKALMEDL